MDDHKDIHVGMLVYVQSDTYFCMFIGRYLYRYVFCHGCSGYTGKCVGTHIDVYIATHIYIYISTDTRLYRHIQMQACMFKHR